MAEGALYNGDEHPFDRLEAHVRDLIKKVEVPVLGLLGGLLPEETRAAIRADLREAPSVRAYIQRLERFPAMFGVWLAEHVMYGVGQDGHFSLYPHVQKALGGISTISNDERDSLWRAFRRAMLKLGIQPLTGRSDNYMADEYVRQAGVPIAFADDLAQRMLQLAKRVGLPDEDDQECLLTWQSALLNKLTLPFSITARRAVERDAQAYYVRAFLRVHANGGHPTSADALEEALAKAFSSDRGASAIKRASILKLLYRDGSLGVLFPPAAASTSYQVVCGEHQRTVRVEEGGCFRPLPAGLHKEVAVFQADGERVVYARLWVDSMSNRLLVFNADGRLVVAGQLGQGVRIELAPGRYVALCRFEPTSPETWDEVSETPRLVEVRLDVPAGREVVLRNGPAHIVIAGHDQPTFSLHGQVRGSLERLELWYGPVESDIEVPADWRVGGQAFELRAVCGLERSVVPVRVGEDGRARVALAKALEELSVVSGVHRIVVELARAGDARSVQRQSILYWFGLETVTCGLRFLFRERPKNLISAGCVGVKLSDKVAEPADDHSRFVRLAFDIGGGRAVHLSWNRPGVFVEVEQPTADGSMDIVARPHGATETVSLTSSKNIIISASEPGYVTLGSTRIFVDFERHPRKVFPASFLASRIEPGARTLRYETNSGGASLPLLELTQPHYATNVATERLANLLTVKLTVSCEPTDVSINGKELSTGREAHAEHVLLAGSWHQSELARVQAYSVPKDGGHVIHVLIDVKTLPHGVWTLGFGARIAGTWGRLEDSGEGRFCVAVALDVLGNELSGSAVLAAAARLELPEVTARLGRLNDHFRQLCSPMCWEQVSWLSQYFTVLVDRMRDHESDFIGELVDMAVAQTSDGVAAGYIAKQSVGASLNRIFTQPRQSYRRVNTKAHPLSVALRAMSELRSSLASVFGSIIHPCAAMAFKNAAQVMQGLRPKHFSLASYRTILTQTHIEAACQLDDELFLPRHGELLGPLHLVHAWRDLERGYKTAQMPLQRRSAAIALARSLHRKYGVFDRSVPAGLQGQELALHPRPPKPEEMDDDQQLRFETMGHIANACAWLAWYCRLDSRGNGPLAGFQVNLADLCKKLDVTGPVISDCVAYYLHVAPAMFSFYLLLWELVQISELDVAVQHA
jgi:hypothetical protein